MIKSFGYAVQNATSPLAPFNFERRSLEPLDVLVDIQYCGVCHSDIHQARNEWGGSLYPMVPGHEIVGKVKEVGKDVKKFSVGDTVGVGVIVDSCRTCEACTSNLEQYCTGHITWTYNGTERDGKTLAQGGYASNIVVDENYVVKIPSGLDLAGAAPLLCAGITTYSPLRHWKVGKGQKVGVLGLGGLGHMAVKFAAALGAEVYVFSRSSNKEQDARKLGAHKFVVTSDEKALADLNRKMDFIIDCVSAPHDINPLLGLLKRDGTLAMVGLPEKPLEVSAFNFVKSRCRLSGSGIGSIKETQEMLDFCGEYGIVSDIEIIPIQKINEAYARVVESDVRYRFVIDLKSLEKGA